MSTYVPSSLQLSVRDSRAVPFLWSTVWSVIDMVCATGQQHVSAAILGQHTMHVKCCDPRVVLEDGCCAIPLKGDTGQAEKCR